MEKVYAYSYCNISATAAMDSGDGLFYPRDTTWKWHEVVTLNTKGIRKGPQPKISCTIMDPFFWQRYVDDAPVNRRSWVYQERLLAPRILHWCKDQIAFECKEGNWAELRPEGLPRFLLRAGTVVEDDRLKSGDVEEGKRLWSIRERERNSNRNNLLRMVQEAESASEKKDEFYLYELWKHWVETYSKMELTNSNDRLLALSGVARMLTGRLEAAGAADQYIAGMWQRRIASQLLWYVNSGSGRQSCDDTRPAKYRAPTFSWASVETPRGVVFPESTDTNILVDILVIRLIYHTAKDKFGLLTDGYIVLRGVLRKVELIDEFNPIASYSDRSHTYAGILSNLLLPY